MIANHRALVLLIATLLPLTTHAQQNPIAFTNTHLIPIDAPEIQNATLIIQNNKILALGPTDSTPLPPNTTTIDASNQTIMPGLVCTHSHIGGRGGGDSSDPIQPSTNIADAVNVHDPGFRRALAGGLTTLNIMPGSGHLMSGQTAYVKLRNSPQTIDDIIIRDTNGQPMGGMKMANGTNSIKDAPFPGTRSKSAALIRQKFIEAIEYRDKIARADDDPDKLPPRDLGLDAMVQILDRKRIVHHHTHRHDDIITVLRLQKEFNFRLVLQHVSEAWKVVDQIAAAGVPCSIITLDSPGGKLEAVDIAYETGGLLEQAGVPVAYHTDDPVIDSRFFLRCAAIGVRAGMSRPAALKSLTLAPANMIDLGDRLGSLTPGKDADLILLSGDPLSVYTHVLQTWVEGQKVFDRSNPTDLLHAQGGYGAGDNTKPYMCCTEEGNNQ